MVDAPRIILHNDTTRQLARKLNARFPNADYRECNSYEDLPGMVKEFRPDIIYTVRFDGTPGYPRESLFSSDGPKWIANGGAGTDHFGVWDGSQKTVTNTAGVAADMMAEYVMGGFLNFTLDISGLQADKEARQWTQRKMLPLKGRTLLIVGLGNTGQAIAARAKAFDMVILGTRAHPSPMQNVDTVFSPDALHDLASKADFIAICTPLTAQTKGLIDGAFFRNTKTGAILADVSRGGVIVQDALLQALENGTLGGAILDVFETEPLPKDNPLWELDNLLISPHCSSVFEGWEIASFDMFLDNLDRWTKQEPLQNIVDPLRGY